MINKGIILAGGEGTRLRPLTHSIQKILIPVYDKPMIYYPLSTLMSLGVTEVMIITSPRDVHQFERLLGDGSQFGISIVYGEQPVALGIADAFNVGREFIGDDPVALILGDNIFAGSLVRSGHSMEFENKELRARIFAYKVDDPTAFGVVSFDENYQAVSLEEKPSEPKSSFAVPGLYFYDSGVLDVVATLKPSARGEYEITDVNRHYLEKGELEVFPLPQGTAWLDTGTIEDLALAAEYVRIVQSREKTIIGSPEFTAWSQGLITDQQLKALAMAYEKTSYGKTLLRVLKRGLD